MAALLQMFYDPTKAFEEVRERRLFWPALIVLAISGCLFWSIVSRKIGMENIARHQMEQSGSLTPEQMQQRMSVVSAPWYNYTTYGFATLGAPLSAAVIAGLLLAVFAMTGKRAAYSQMLGAVSYSMVPFYVLTVIAGCVLLMLVADPETRDPQSLVAFNIGAFLDKATTNKALYSLASSLDLLSIGQILLMSYGTSRITRTKWSQSIVLIGGLWLLFVVGKMGWAAMRG